MTAEQIEAQYLKSVFVREICVFEAAAAGAVSRLHAVVVPDMRLMRERRIVNVGDLVRFEIEGQSIHLPPQHRVTGYDIWFEALPRTPDGQVQRHAVADRLAVIRAHRAGAALGLHEADDQAAAIVAAIARTATGPVSPSANLEIDLGFDSMARVELFAELEATLRTRIPEHRLHEVLTVEDLVAAFREGDAVQEAAGLDQRPWARLLDDLPPRDSSLGGLLEDRRVSAIAVFALLRLGRAMLPRTVVSGLHHLPSRGPYIIAPNHQSYLDSFLVCSVLPFAILRQLFVVAASEYFESAIMAWAARQCNLLPVDPDAQLLPAMKAAAFGLRHGKILLLFPEGERSIDGSVKRFKKGAAILSRHLEVPVVPVAISGVYELWPRNRPLNWRALLPWSGHRVQVAFGAPLPADPAVSYGDAALTLQHRVSRMWERLEALPRARKQG